MNEVVYVGLQKILLLEMGMIQVVSWCPSPRVEHPPGLTLKVGTA